MPSDPDIPPPSSHSSTTAPSPPPAHDDPDSDTAKRGDDPPALAVIPPSSPLPPLPASASTSKPPSAAPGKPRSSRARARSPSPSPPPPPPPPLTTIRLTVSLGGPENYEVDIATLAKSTGQRQPTPVPVKAPDTTDSEAGDGPDKEDKPKRKRKRKNLNSEYYDLADPFIDDSELAVDQRTYFAQTKQTGFYVSSGEVALLKDKTPKKPRSRRKPADGAPASASAAANASPQRQSTAKKTATVGRSHNDPFTIDDEDQPLPEKRRRYVTVMEGNKKRKVADIDSYAPSVRDAFADLKVAISQANWEMKGKFPVAVKPPLVHLAVQAIISDEYDDDFFNLMPTIFPYNKFTMLKLIKRNVFPEHVRVLTERQDVLLAELSQITAAGFRTAREEFARSIQLWEKKKAKVKEAEAEVEEVNDVGSGMDVDGGTTRDPSAGASSTGGAGLGVKEAVKDPHPRPTQRYRLTERMKQIVWKLVTLSNEICRLENEKNALDGSTVQVSEQGLRKVLYQKIVSVFPDGWMSSGQISREVSAMKKKQEKVIEIQEDGG